jgi:hypothetical protein
LAVAEHNALGLLGYAGEVLDVAGAVLAFLRFDKVGVDDRPALLVKTNAAERMGARIGGTDRAGELPRALLRAPIERSEELGSAGLQVPILRVKEASDSLAVSIAMCSVSPLGWVTNRVNHCLLG